MGRYSVGAVLAIALMAAPAFAQTVAVAQLSGTVLDESGGSLPGVEVTVLQTDTGMTRFMVTNESGGFVFTSLPVGPYKLTAKLSGFSNFEQTGIVLVVDDGGSLNVRLKLGTLSETITVAADATLVETSKVNVGTVISQKQIVDLPLNGRSALQLIVLSGSAVENTGDRQSPVSELGGESRSPAAPATARCTGRRRLQQRPQNNTGNGCRFPTRSRSSGPRPACAPRAAACRPAPR